MEFYKESIEKAYKELNSSQNGLGEEEAQLRLRKYGPNEISKAGEVSPFKLLLTQIQNFIVYVLIAAAVLSFLIGESNDAIVIGVIIVLNVILGFVQEYKAEKAIEALKKLSSPKSLVIRAGKLREINSSEIVPGDILVIEEGNHLSADARVIESNSLSIDESTFSGESLPVLKNTGAIKESCISSERANTLFSGTVAVRGRGKAIVFNTGSNTELGKIAKEIGEPEEKMTPLQLQLKQLGVYITIAILCICAIILVIDTVKSGDLFGSLLVAVALAVAAIPEGLPAVITITLALGTQRMAKKNALIRRLHAVETLGSTTVICSDKTGTLTCNQMTVTRIYANGKEIEVSGKGEQLEGGFFLDGKKLNGLSNYRRIFEIGKLCNNATLDGPSDPTEKAILVASEKSGFSFDYKRIMEIPFSSETKYMITVCKEGKRKISYLKGAPEVVLNMCKGIELDREMRPLTSQERKRIVEEYNKMAENALRVLAFAYNPEGEKNNFVFVGLMGMIDPPRENVKESIQKCKEAGIRVVMITGDHAITANAIAKELGIKGAVLTGAELEKMSLEQLENVVESISIYARVSPEHKVMILKALRNKGHVVAMTGDGVNDAPALKLADIGTAVGSGTDVAKEASDMILVDDNFVSVVSAVMEGRGVYDNIKKFVNYLFSCNLGEVLIIFLALLLEMPLPLIAIQILWVNLLTDGFPALALGIDPVDPDVMKKPPRKKDEKIINEKDLVNILVEGSVIALGVLFLFNSYLPQGEEHARTIAFTSLVLFQMFNVLNYRAGERSIFGVEFIRNKWLLAAIVFSLLLQVIVIYSFNGMFGTVPLTAMDWIVCIIVSSSILIIYEVVRLIKRIRESPSSI